MFTKIAFLLALVCGAVLAQQETVDPKGRQEGDAWTNAYVGLRIERPGNDWAFAETAAAGLSGYKLKINPAQNPAIEVSVQTAPAGGDDSQAVQRKALALVRGDSRFDAVESIAQRIAGRKAPGIRVDFSATDGKTYRIEQIYVVDNDVRYIFQCHAPADAFADQQGAFEAIRLSLGLSPVSRAVLAAGRIHELAARCGSEIDWSGSWAQAATRARDENRLVLVAVRSYPGFTDLPDQIRAGAMMNPDVVELVRERCVALSLGAGMAAPFRSQESYGMSGSTFGQALLLVAPDGRVLHETHVMQGDAVYAFLCENLAKHPESAGTPVSPKGGQLRRAELHLRRGELTQAGELLGDASTSRAHRLRASLHRRLRDGEAALDALQALREAGGEDEVAIALEEVLVLMRMGEDDRARGALSRARTTEAAAAQQAEALFWEGILAQRAGANDALVPWWTLTGNYPEHRLAWQAAAVMEATRFQPSPRIRTEWPAEDSLATLRTPAPERLGRKRLRETESAAVTFLLEAQRDDGSWISPTEVSGRTQGPNPFVDAITAICGRALLQRREAEGCAEAVQNALEFTLATHQRAKETDAERSYMDYTVWSQAFMLWFLADCLDAGVGAPEQLLEVGGELVADLGQKQKAGGGWSYYVTRNLGDGGGIPPQSISFVTASVVMALLRAPEAGIPVPEAMTETALDCLESMRNSNGAFAYMWQPGADVRSTRRPGAAGRAPLCELALLRGGRGSVARVRGGLEIFRDHRRDLGKQLGKVLMHAGPDGQGCHYLMFDYGFAAAAVAALPEGQRAEHRDWVLDLIFDARSVEGGFRGTPINGWAFGTAMALLAFRNLEAVR